MRNEGRYLQASHFWSTFDIGQTTLAGRSLNRSLEAAEKPCNNVESGVSPGLGDKRSETL